MILISKLHDKFCKWFEDSPSISTACCIADKIHGSVVVEDVFTGTKLVDENEFSYRISGKTQDFIVGIFGDDSLSTIEVGTNTTIFLESPSSCMLPRLLYNEYVFKSSVPELRVHLLYFPKPRYVKFCDMIKNSGYKCKKHNLVYKNGSLTALSTPPKFEGTCTCFGLCDHSDALQMAMDEKWSDHPCSFTLCRGSCKFCHDTIILDQCSKCMKNGRYSWIESFMLRGDPVLCPHYNAHRIALDNRWNRSHEGECETGTVQGSCTKCHESIPINVCWKCQKIGRYTFLNSFYSRK